MYFSLLFFIHFCVLLLLFNYTSTPVGYFVSSQRERENRDRRNMPLPPPAASNYFLLAGCFHARVKIHGSLWDFFFHKYIAHSRILGK